MRKRWSERIHIRPLIDTDLPLVAALERREPSGWNDRLVRSEFDYRQGVQLAACLEGMCIGWLCARYTETEADLLKMHVDTQLRRAGVGTLLLTAVERALRGFGVRQVFLEVRSKNEGARLFYQRAGFAEISRRIGYYRQPEDDALLYRKYMCNA